MSCLSECILESPGSSPSLEILDQQLLHGSVFISSKQPFSKWSKEDQGKSYELMQRTAQVWKNCKITEQYLIYGQINSRDHELPFNWEMVPYAPCKTTLGRIVQQLQVLWRTVFGGIAISQEDRQQQTSNYKNLFNSVPQSPPPEDMPHESNDAFCKSDTLQRQRVVTGEKVNVLFNYAPIGFGGEKLHFLIVPKYHREKFSDVTQEEYQEACALTQKLVDHFSETRKTLKNVYLMNKTGIDAGQSVPHWHLHVVFSSNAAQNFWGRLTVLRNILFGSSPMKKEALEQKVSSLKEELISLNS
ncbi:MAG: HIT family protein [Candidatus Rhabdochlamydia sp.]